MSAPSRTIRFTLNGESVSAEVAPHHNLIDLLQQQFDLHGARESCCQGLCGCCTVLVDGQAVSGCLYLAGFVDGTEVVTIEHLATGERRFAGAALATGAVKLAARKLEGRSA